MAMMVGKKISRTSEALMNLGRVSMYFNFKYSSPPVLPCMLMCSTRSFY